MNFAPIPQFSVFVHREKSTVHRNLFAVRHCSKDALYKVYELMIKLAKLKSLRIYNKKRY